MPSMQEMLVSYAVKIDESGVTRLHTLLDQNRKKATEAAAAFTAAEKAVSSLGKALTDVLKRFPQSGSLLSRPTTGNTPSALPDLSAPTTQTTTDTGRREREFTRFASVLSDALRKSTAPTARTNTYAPATNTTGTVSLQADLTPVLAAADQAARLLQSKAPTLRMRGDATSLISTATSAASRVKSLLSDLTANLSSGGGSGGGSGSGSTPTRMLSTGGRFASPTSAQLAEDGDPEYVIPVRKDKKAVPLITRMLGELSADALQTVRARLNLPSQDGSSGPLFDDPLSTGLLSAEPRSAGSLTTGPLSSGAHPAGSFPPDSLSAFFSSAPTLSSISTGTTIHNHYDVSAPCTIQVHSTGGDPRLTGEAAYDAAERHLLTSLRGVMQ